MMQQFWTDISSCFKAVLVTLPLVLVGCGGESDRDLCKPFDGLTPICGFQSPEDLVLLPDGSGILISEYGHMGESEGSLSILGLPDYQRNEIYSSQSSNDLRAPNPIWGENDCQEPTRFSPHGIDLSQRPGGRWQLLVVNHGEREAIEMFELMQDQGGAWQVAWRGCVEAIDDTSFNDVAALDNGFVATRMMSREAGMAQMVDYFLGRDTGFLWRWDLQQGFSKVANTDSVLPNGVVAEQDGNRIVLNVYGENKVRVIDRVSNEVLHELDVPSADNTNWDINNPGKLLIASHDVSMLDMMGCMGDASGNCPAQFEIIELDINDYSTRTLFRSDGEYYGAGTAALRVGEQLFIGSFTGERLLVAPVGYGVN